VKRAKQDLGKVVSGCKWLRWLKWLWWRLMTHNLSHLPPQINLMQRFLPLASF